MSIHARIVYLPATIILGIAALVASSTVEAARPNIVWIIAEDASPHIGCFGGTTIRTPNLDRMAADGVKFSHAFVTSPVCSPSRSAMVSGMYPTTLGAHNHRSQMISGKGKGYRLYFDSYRLPKTIRLIPELFAQAGYYVVNGGIGKDDYHKQDYNFVRDNIYRGTQWTERAHGQPFFAQIQLHGGKNRGANVTNPVSPAAVKLPPYYADDPVLRTGWAQYLKQFLYDEGIHVPLIVRFPNGNLAGTVRDDLVLQIDVAATSLDLAGIPIPDYVQGKSIFSPNYHARREVFSARDRCDETVDIIRSVRTARFKYIRNFLSFMSHMQPNSYKDLKEITQVSRKLHAAGKLDDLQDRIFAPTRPPEELYDLENDPDETVNLASNPEFAETLRQLRADLRNWMIESRDLGLIPEPILEDLGRAYGNKSVILTHPDNAGLVEKLLTVFDHGQAADLAELQLDLKSDRPSIRYWAATWLGVSGDASVVRNLHAHLTDENAAVRIAAALALYRLHTHENVLPYVVREVDSGNPIVGMYALRALEQMGDSARPALPTIRQARSSDYQYSRRLAKRLMTNLADSTEKNDQP
jgi:arylsulfatase A-like enzyme